MTMLPITYGYVRVSKADDDAKNLETQLRLLAVSISKVIDPGIYTVIDPPWQRGTFPNIRLWSGSQSPPFRPGPSRARWGDSLSR